MEYNTQPGIAFPNRRIHVFQTKCFKQNAELCDDAA